MTGARSRIFAALLAFSLLTGAVAAAPVSALAADGEPSDEPYAASSYDAENSDDVAGDSADVVGVTDDGSSGLADEEIGDAAFDVSTDDASFEIMTLSSTGETITITGTFRWDYAAQELELLNKQRTAAGKSKLHMNSSLQRTAMQRAAEIVVNFDHIRPDGSKWYTAFPDYYAAGENLAKGQTTPDAVTTAWMNSEGHRENILSGDYNAVGICCLYYNGTYFWVQSFSDLGGESYVSKTSQTGSVSVTVSYSVVSQSKVEKIKAQNSSSSNSGNSGNSGSGNSGNSNSTMAQAVTMYRLYNPWSGEHLYTSNLTEVSSCEKAGWKYEGVAWYAPKSSSTPVYRLYNKYTGDHHYTTSATEYDTCGKQGWTKEGIGWYSESASSGVPLYRGFNRYVTVGTHHYTTSWSEMSSMEKVGWKYEGVAWYGVK